MSVLSKRVPLGRAGTIDEVCEAVTYLVSPAAAYVTGATLLIDGGTSLLGPRSVPRDDGAAELLV